MNQSNVIKKTVKLLASALCLILLVSAPLVAKSQRLDAAARNVIFFHPDGYGLSHWDALRILIAGPDGRLNWDRLPHLATYTGHMRDRLTGTSHGGATTHAYGVKVHFNSFGLDGANPITALSGQQQSIMEEAITAGFATALIQTGSLAEPGTAAFVASVERRGDHAEIVRQVIESGVDIIFGGGERVLLPAGVVGRHGEGTRTDNLNLIERARELGYAVVYTRAELLALPRNTARVLGVFAHHHTFNDLTEEALRAAGLPLYVPTAPTIAEMAQVALELLANNPKTARQGFFMVAEEEGTDNFPNISNAAGSFEAGRRADEAFGVFRKFVGRSGDRLRRGDDDDDRPRRGNRPRTLLLTTADSSAGSKNVLSLRENVSAVGTTRVNTNTAGEFVSAPLDGVDGADTASFISEPDRNGNTWPFAVTWATSSDVAGGLLVRAEGRNARRVSELGVVDNTDIYRLMYWTLFDRWLE